MRRRSIGKRTRLHFGLVIALALVALPFSELVPTVHAAPKRIITALASAARTASVNSQSFDIGEAQTLQGYLNITAASGTSPTLDVTIQDSPDGTIWFDAAAFTQATAASTQVKLANSATRVLAKYVRVKTVIGGTTPSFTFTVHLLAY